MEIAYMYDGVVAYKPDYHGRMPFYRFLSEVILEGERSVYIHGELQGLTPMPRRTAPDVDPYSRAYDTVKSAWVSRGIWDDSWSVLPGRTWFDYRHTPSGGLPGGDGSVLSPEPVGPSSPEWVKSPSPWPSPPTRPTQLQPPGFALQPAPVGHGRPAELENKGKGKEVVAAPGTSGAKKDPPPPRLPSIANLLETVPAPPLRPAMPVEAEGLPRALVLDLLTNLHPNLFVQNPVNSVYLDPPAATFSSCLPLEPEQQQRLQDQRERLRQHAMAHHQSWQQLHLQQLRQQLQQHDESDDGNGGGGSLSSPFDYLRDKQGLTAVERKRKRAGSATTAAAADQEEAAVGSPRKKRKTAAAAPANVMTRKRTRAATAAATAATTAVADQEEVDAAHSATAAVTAHLGIRKRRRKDEQQPVADPDEAAVGSPRKKKTAGAAPANLAARKRTGAATATATAATRAAADAADAPREEPPARREGMEQAGGDGDGDDGPREPERRRVTRQAAATAAAAIAAFARPKRPAIHQKTQKRV